MLDFWRYADCSELIINDNFSIFYIRSTKSVLYGNGLADFIVTELLCEVLMKKQENV